jgi:hypothetical protein
MPAAKIIPFPAKPKTTKRRAKVVNATEAIFTFEEVEDGFEISSESGVITVRKVDDGTELPAGTALLIELSGVGDEIAGMVEIPVEFLWLNLAGARHSPEFAYFLHPVDYDAAVLMLKKIGVLNRVT